MRLLIACLAFTLMNPLLAICQGYVEPPTAEAVAEPTIFHDCIITAYTAGVESTGKDVDHPDYGITASGRKVADGMCAAPKEIPFGTVLLIGGKTYVVEDRGGDIRWEDSPRIDVYIPDLDAAKEFGRRIMDVEVVRWGR